MRIVNSRDEAIRLATRIANDLNNEEHGDYYSVDVKDWAWEVHVLNEYQEPYMIFQYKHRRAA